MFTGITMNIISVAIPGFSPEILLAVSPVTTSADLTKFPTRLIPRKYSHLNSSAFEENRQGFFSKKPYKHSASLVILPDIFKWIRSWIVRFV